MNIHSFDISRIKIPLARPFVTAVRRADAVEAVRITLRCEDGICGLGEAPASALITGETLPSIEEAIKTYIAPAIIGKSAESNLNHEIQSAIHGNSSAKAAVEMAFMNLRTQVLGIPLYRLLGEEKKARNLTNDITISIGSLDSMTADALSAINEGHSILKIKSGSQAETDARQLIGLWQNIRSRQVLLRIDANQGWSPSQAIKIIQAWEDASIPIDIIEQPVPAWDFEGMAEVAAYSSFPVAADESVFSPRDALRCIQMKAAQVINIKLMKCGGLNRAVEICNLCRQNGLECMIGCMLESEISVAAAAHLAASQPVITRVDLDAPLLYAPGFNTGSNPEFCGPSIKFKVKP